MNNPADTSTRGQMPSLRKRPVQSGSRALVDAVEQACLQILDEAGEAALTVARIAELSGVAVGSIYQYFPSKDAIVALLYERVLDEESEQLLRVRERLVGMPLKAALEQILANIIRVETRLFRLNKVFHLRYHSALHLGMWRGPYTTTGEFIEATWLPLLQMYEQEITTQHPALAAYLLGQGLRSVFRSVLEDMPEQLESRALLDSLVAMAIGCLRPCTQA
ncbi:TetR family transcriptional regulator [Pseudomonas fragi]|uniref:TetR family transcriptional regulator n=1 Tax=Pseudomonas fragi TaxID=296 RepID=A0A266LS77_PSEFR|nr:TetR/AcrR family transcriptional regulator [Pseudomonas fragi]OZY40510.1 TetR family transcriptional regulator [Pseudomonas fragi]